MMGTFKIPWGLTGALLAATYLHAICVSASPSINVGLKASFDSAPYLLELLETAGDENSTSYFPLLDRIADGHFAATATDKELYEKFIKVLQDDGHFDSEALSSYQLALSLRSAAPRIEAHYQYYHTSVEPSLNNEEDTSCPVWVLFNGAQYCSPSLDAPHGDIKISGSPNDLPFDRVQGNSSAPPSVLYADITSPLFGKFHKTLVKTALQGTTSYRVRHRKPKSLKSTPLVIGGYGVELALKRTDYIVIDDRDEGDATSSTEPATEIKLEDQEVADLKPLSSSDLIPLGLKAASFVMQSDNPFETLIKLSQDFPKYSASISTHHISPDFLAEHQKNRQALAPSGMNVFWVNGLQIIERQVDAFNLLDTLRRERKLINNVKQLGITGPEAISLLSHPIIFKAKVDDEPQRYDWKDWEEGSNVIIWLNDLEKDKRYSSWSDDLQKIMQRTYPGQLPSVKKDIFNIVLPVDLTVPEDVLVIIEQIQTFVKRALPLRFGVVPIGKTQGAVDQAKILYHLLDTYGIATILAYLESMYAAKKTASPSASVFDALVKGRKLRNEKVVMSVDEVLKSDTIEERIRNLQKWVTRLSADTPTPPLFVNGVAIPRNDDWLQVMSTRVTTDLQSVQRAVSEDTMDPTSWLPGYFLVSAVARRNPLVVPEDEASLKVFDVNGLHTEHPDIVKNSLKIVPVVKMEEKLSWTHLSLITDLSTADGQQLLKTAAEFQALNPGIELNVLNNAVEVDGTTDILAQLKNKTFETNDLLSFLNNSIIGKTAKVEEIRDEARQYYETSKSFVESVGLETGQHGLLINGRLVGPIFMAADFIEADFAQLLHYERLKRILPAYEAMEVLGLTEKITDPLTGAKFSSVIATSTISNVPEGMFEQAPTMRINNFEAWAGKHTAILAGEETTSSIRITALVDPASEQGQRWIPILKVLSDLEGVSLKLYLNPKERLEGLPVKRFYRYVLDSKPSFHEDGSLESIGASFSGVPQEALLTVGMDVPPSWLVAPKISVHDLDNIKLSSVKSDVEALYELENILIEGHSRETPSAAAPRGAQLVLGTERDPHFADTIIMSNLGYFQFKANPGFYKIDLQGGRSSEIFQIDSLGSLGWTPVPGDESTDVALMSFQGTTLYPRLSRKPGQETEDVLEARNNTAMDFVSKGVQYAENWLGLGKGKKEVATKDLVHADINIFSVASGHLYERMLNIMMVSVMKHTKHTVKFWFIEQFLSPSFKDFLPHLAAEYGFKYEMVTYKWPHWLREQKEKQREIWGYKILFLDVLFPTSLDKVIFVDADQIVRTDMIELVNHDLKGAPYGFTPMCDSRTEMEGFRFWKQGYWKSFLKGLPYHISALYVVDLHRFRQLAAGDRLRQQYHQLSADPNSLSNLDQDLPNHMQTALPIHSLPQEWLWCETWCSDESLTAAKTIDLCNNPQTKEPKLDRARRQVPEWTVYDDEIAAVDQRRKGIVGSETSASTEANTKSRKFEETAKPHVIDEL